MSTIFICPPSIVVPLSPTFISPSFTYVPPSSFATQTVMCLFLATDKFPCSSLSSVNEHSHNREYGPSNNNKSNTKFPRSSTLHILDGAEDDNRNNSSTTYEPGGNCFDHDNTLSDPTQDRGNRSNNNPCGNPENNTTSSKDADNCKFIHDPGSAHVENSTTNIEINLAYKDQESPGNRKNEPHVQPWR